MTSFSDPPPQIVIAIDVEDKDFSHFADVYDHGTSTSGWWLLWQKLISRKKIITFKDTIMWLTCINHR